MDIPHMNMKGWKLETVSNKWRKEFEFRTRGVKSLTSLMKWII